MSVKVGVPRIIVIVNSRELFIYIYTIEDIIGLLK